MAYQGTTHPKKLQEITSSNSKKLQPLTPLDSSLIRQKLTF